MNKRLHSFQKKMKICKDYRKNKEIKYKNVY